MVKVVRTIGLTNAMRDVAEFRNACNLPISPFPTIPDAAAVALQSELADEEYTELRIGIEQRDLVKITDGITDLIYILVGMALEFGIPLPDAFEEVHASNMAKVDPSTGKVLRRADGKILKPKGWKPPAIGPILERHSMAFAQRVADLERIANE